MPSLEARRRPTARQRALLAELEALFLAEGFAVFTLDDIAARLRCSKSTLYALAPSKEQLAVKVVTQFFRGAAERIEERIAGIDDAPKLIGEYLAGVAEHLNRASPEFMRDLAELGPARGRDDRADHRRHPDRRARPADRGVRRRSVHRSG
jgi:AcrR family transcriptional regulator